MTRFFTPLFIPVQTRDPHCSRLSFWESRAYAFYIVVYIFCVVQIPLFLFSLELSIHTIYYHSKNIPLFCFPLFSFILSGVE